MNDPRPNLSHVLARVFDTPLMIMPAKLEAILAVLEGKVSGLRMEPQDTSANDNRPYQVLDGVAVVPVIGTLVHRASGMDAMSGLTSYQRLDGMLTTALNDPQVSAIMLDIDSPGGEVAGNSTLADKIAQIGRVKPVWSYVNELAASAAYAIASAAEKVIVPSSALVGSIGVVMVRADVSEADQQNGVKYNFFYGGARKVDLQPHVPLSKDASAALQGLIDSNYALFVDLVARNRKMDAKAVRATEAGIFQGQDAINAGLADEIGTFEMALSDLRKRATTGSSTNRQSGMARKETVMSVKGNTQPLAPLPDENDVSGGEGQAVYGNWVSLHNGMRALVGEASPEMLHAAPLKLKAIDDPRVIALEAQLAQMQSERQFERAQVQATGNYNALLTAQKVYPAEGKLFVSFAAALYAACAATPALQMQTPDGATISLAQGFDMLLAARPKHGLLGEAFSGNLHILDQDEPQDDGDKELYSDMDAYIARTSKKGGR